MADRTPRLKDVAELANVSLSAASRILRGDVERFGEETCRRVREASEKLGWRRNLLVDGMQTGRTKTIGVMIPPHDSFWVAVLSGIHTKLAEEDYLPITVWLGDLQHMPHFEAKEEEGLRLINRLLDRRVEAMILWPPFGLAYYDHFPELRDQTVPVVTIDHRSDTPLGDTVTTNEEHATKLVAKHLLELGHQRIAYLSGRELPSQTWAINRRRCFEAILRDTPGVEFGSWRHNRDGSNADEVALKLLSSELKPTAVFAATDHEALGLYRAAAKLGLQVPGDVSIVGFADLDFAAAMSPPLTTVRQRPTFIGERAASLALERILGHHQMSEFIDAKIDADLVLRESTGPAPQSR